MERTSLVAVAKLEDSAIASEPPKIVAKALTDGHEMPFSVQILGIKYLPYHRCKNFKAPSLSGCTRLKLQCRTPSHCCEVVRRVRDELFNALGLHLALKGNKCDVLR